MIDKFLIVLGTVGALILIVGIVIITQTTNESTLCKERGGIYVSTYVHKCFKKDAIIPLD